MSITALGAVTIPFPLRDEEGWELQVEELHQALESAKGLCNPVALYIINPGNPAGTKIKLHQYKSHLCIFIDITQLLSCHVTCRYSSKQKVNARGDPVRLREEACPSG